MTATAGVIGLSALRSEIHSAATSHRIVDLPPVEVDAYRELPSMFAWLEQTRRYCENPRPDHARAADWLLDNGYQVARAIRRVQEDLPVKFYQRLAAVDGPKGKPVPRVFVLAQDMLDRLGPQISKQGLVSYLNTYQEVSVLSLAELWALPSMLRLANIERLSDAFSQLNPRLTPAFPISPFALAPGSQDATEGIAGALTNLISIHSIKWADVVDLTSCVEATFEDDPADIYRFMRFETRDRYRKTVEELADRSDLSELDVAREAVRLAQEAKADLRMAHVGYWLIDDGLQALEASIGYRVTAAETLRRRAVRNRHSLYAMALIAGVLAALIVPAVYLSDTATSPWHWIGGAVLSLLPATVLSVSVVYWLITALVPPRILPEMDFAKAIPKRFATAVVVPIIVGDEAEVPGIAEKLLIRRLSNPDKVLRFVVLSDLADAVTERVPGDDRIELALVAAIRDLNTRYGDEDGGPFFLMHRTRKYNPGEQVWMGWERKRGKLETFNRFVLGRGDERDAFALTEGPVERLQGLPFALVLDADTDLPPGVAARLVGTLAHPLNRARFDPDTGRVASGYTILQPRLEILPHTNEATQFSHLFSGDTAIDIYSRAVSDVYQDVFDTGIFVGKGIYDIAAVEQSLAGRVPENRILSHDLFEGVHGRAGLVSNIVLYEDFPANYPEYAMRYHRWLRGDWQLLPWLSRRVPSADGGLLANPLSGLDRWKIIDNLRRSLVPPALLFLFVGGWMILPGSAAVWTTLALAAPGSYLIGEIHGVLTGGVRRGSLASGIHRFSESGGHWFLSIAFLVSDTLIALDAIFRTLWRLKFTRRNLLEWTSSAHYVASIRGRTIGSAAWSLMWPSSALSLVLAGYLAVYNFGALLPAAPVLALWFVAPLIAIRTARPRRLRRETLSEPQRRFLVGIARRTWHFFATFTGPEDNWLPPDNFQEDPRNEVAHRTSPTNIGMFLVSALSARDLGFITTNDLLARSRNTVDTLERLKNHRGHILNWFDTRTLTPLEPQYVSTVDSGNLAISLIALKQGCIELAQTQAIDSACWDGLRTTLGLLTNAALRLPARPRAKLGACTTRIDARIEDALGNPAHWKAAIDDISDRLWHDLETAALEAVTGTDAFASEVPNEIDIWLGALHQQLHAIDREIGHLFPWMPFVARPPPTLADLAQRIESRLSPLASMPQLIGCREDCIVDIDIAMTSDGLEPGVAQWLAGLKQAIEDGVARQSELSVELCNLAKRCHALAYGMDFTFLYDDQARLFVIGYNLSVGQMDGHHYDLLATEARLASFFAVAKHDAPVEHWFSLSRPITRIRGKPSILSWNGSMFEYLMPPLFLPSRRDTLLGESEFTAVDYQRRYATERGVPWGISESAFGVTDAEGNYQYRAFGVPGLGIRRGLTEDLVVSPYASALALCAWPSAAVENLLNLESLGAVGPYGFIDALDFTPSRILGQGQFFPVKTHMAHHQGMTITAIANVLKGDIHVKRVMREESLTAIDLLLQERVPWGGPVEKGRIDEIWAEPAETQAPEIPSPWVPSHDSLIPQMHLLGNGRLSARVSESGAGGLSWEDQLLTRWRPDPTRDCYGTWVYVRDAESRNLWSVGRQPTGASTPENKTVFHHHMVETFRRDHDIAIRMEVTIAPIDDVEIREITVTNEADKSRVIDITSYAEVVLSLPQDDERHPAFSKLFVGSTHLPNHDALLFERRPRRPETRPPVMMHKLVSEDPDIELFAFETDRARFIGRNGSAKAPQGFEDGLSGTTGWTLDAIMALQVRLRLKPLETRKFAFLTIVGASRADVLEIATRYPLQSLGRVFRDASLAGARELQRLNIEPSRLPEIQLMASLLLHPLASLRAVPSDLAAGKQSQPDLWRFGVSGDLPILLTKMDDTGDPKLLDILVRAQRLLRSRGLKADFVILHTGRTGYEGPLREHVLSVLRDSNSEGFLGRNGGIHLLSSDQMDLTTRQGLEAAAHIVLAQDDQEIAEKLDRVLEKQTPNPRFEPATRMFHEKAQPLPRPKGLVFDNGIGGFDVESGEYVIHLRPETHTPAPWCNVLANDGFGAIVSESGLGFTWAVNSGEYRLTPWSNDPVANEPGEVLYLRDEMTAEVWTPTPAPLGHGADCQIRHGPGYTKWTQNSQELEQELLVFVPADAPVKLIRLRLKNTSDSKRRITATYYAEWVLGAMQSVSKPHVVCAYDSIHKAIVARNGWNPEFGDRMAFLTASIDPHSVTGDRHDFLGKEGDTSAPEALSRWDLGGRFTPGGDACAGYQVHLDIAENGTTEVVFAFGEEADEATARTLIAEWRDPAKIDAALAGVARFWDGELGVVQVKTPDPAFDIMVNRWLPYQNIACRLMARAGFYQAGGAFGFRDQLQDVLALLFTDPARARDQILLAARHQFEEGDVLHWWHPPVGRGVRTRCSDDYLWLAYVTARYIQTTDDAAILGEEIPFLAAPQLGPDESDRYARFDQGASASLFEHCARALDRMMAVGGHGLPLIGTGDWNDGMDRVGEAGKGESTWLAWFQLATIRIFSPYAARLGHKDRADRWRRHSRELRKALDGNAWDGAWFVRAFDDDGEPWGSRLNDECQIDLIAQSWSVLSGERPTERVRTAMESAAVRLVDEDNRLIRLLDPPFHDTTRDPGYIQAYPPGIRENGGQYTHAAAWYGLAFAGLGDGDRAWQMFDIVNPIRRSLDETSARTYLREPYVLPGDVSGGAHPGTGGWSWYTGAAGWTWQLAAQGILGLRLNVATIQIDPCLPKDWGRAEVQLKGPNGSLSIVIEDPDHIGKGVARITVDGKRARTKSISFPGRGNSRNVVVRLASPKAKKRSNEPQ